MIGLEREPSLYLPDFDLNAAFQDAISDTISDAELAIEEKVRRVEHIINAGTDPLYADFVDFRAAAAQIEMMCNHDHAFGQSVSESQSLTGLLDAHNHDHEDETKPGKKSKKKKKKRSWFGVTLEA